MTRPLPPPFWWFGGKGNMVEKIVPMLPYKHDLYVEVFGGAGSILLGKPPSKVEVLNDLNSDIINFYRVLRDPEQAPRLVELCSKTLYAREEYEWCKATWKECEDPVERAYRWYIDARWSFSGVFDQSWSYGLDTSAAGMAKNPHGWLNTIALLPEIHRRLSRVQIENLDWRVCIDKYEIGESVCWYLDPPYVKDVRASGHYKHDMENSDHEDLVKRILKLKGAVVLSGYEHPIYKPLEEAGWEVHRFETSSFAVGKTRASGVRGLGTATALAPRVEIVWRNPACRVMEGQMLL